jgi:hypothetical protein
VRISSRRGFLDEENQGWKCLLEQGAQTVYPAHGEPFSADVIRKALAA